MVLEYSLETCAWWREFLQHPQTGQEITKHHCAPLISGYCATPKSGCRVAFGRLSHPRRSLWVSEYSAEHQWGGQKCFQNEAAYPWAVLSLSQQHWNAASAQRFQRETGNLRCKVASCVSTNFSSLSSKMNWVSLWHFFLDQGLSSALSCWHYDLFCETFASSKQPSAPYVWSR